MVSSIALSLLVSVALAAAEDIEVFLTPHSHCDPGWLQTFSGYHSSQVAQILDNIVRDLSSEPRRRFIWAEQSFFQRWYDVQPQHVRDQVRSLVASGKLEFAEGGWVQSDEASTHPVSLIDHVTEGHDYIAKNFGVRPRIAWQIDPFGHSSLTPEIFAQMGMEALVTNRIHYSLKSELKNLGKMEFMWAPSASLGDKAAMATHVLHTHYSAPKGFDFEEGWSSVRVSASNVAQRARVLVDECKSRSRAYPSKKLFVPWGDDFKFRNSATQWSQMDQLVDYINGNNMGVKIRYSTLSEYFDALASAAPQLSTFRGDFFPYADNGQSYWTGYYTSKPLTKLVIRDSMAKLRSAEVFVSIAAGMRAMSPQLVRRALADIRRLRRELGLAQHHDGITGTSRKMVDEDYRSRLWGGAGKLETSAASAVGAVMSKSHSDQLPLISDPWRAGKPVSHFPSDAQRTGSAGALDENQYGALVVSNSLGWTRDVLVRVGRLPDLKVAVVGSDGVTCVPSQLEHAWMMGHGEHSKPDEDEGPVVTFAARGVPALGAATYFLVTGGSPAAKSLAAGCWATWARTTVHMVSLSMVRGGRGNTGGGGGGGGGAAGAPGAIEFKPVAELPELHSGTLTLGLGPDGPETITSKVDKVAGKPVKMPFRHTMAQYSTHKSGSYIFNPTGPAGTLPDTVELVRVVRGSVTEEAHYCTNGVIRRYVLVGGAGGGETSSSGADVLTDGVYVTLDRVTAGQNKEVVHRFHTGLKTSGTLFTDNGLEYRARTPFSPSQPVQPNAGGPDVARRYYPSVNGAYLSGGRRHRFTVVTDHSQGVTSLAEGQMELMVARQLMQDDGRGLSQPNHDTAVFQSRYKVLFGAAAKHARSARRHIAEFNNPPALYFADRGAIKPWPADPAAYLARFGGTFSPVAPGAIPDDVHVMTLAPRDGATGDVALRLHNMLDVADVDKPPAARVDITGLFSPLLRVKNVRRRKLSLVQSYDEPRALSQPWKTMGDTIYLQFDPKIPAGQGGVSQNTDEEGVFLSDIAMKMRTLLGSEDGADRPPVPRNLLSAGDSVVAVVEPMEIATYLITLHATGSAPRAVQQVVAPVQQQQQQEKQQQQRVPTQVAKPATQQDSSEPELESSEVQTRVQEKSVGSSGSKVDTPAAPNTASIPANGNTGVASAGSNVNNVNSGDGDDLDIAVPQEGDLIGIPAASSGDGASVTVARAPGVLPVDDDGDAPPFAKGFEASLGSGAEDKMLRAQREVSKMKMFRHRESSDHSHPGGGEFFIVLGLTAVGMLIMFLAFFKLTRSKRVKLMD